MKIGLCIVLDLDKCCNGLLLGEEAVKARRLPALTIGAVGLEGRALDIPAFTVLGMALAKMTRSEVASAPGQRIGSRRCLGKLPFNLKDRNALVVERPHSHHA